MSVERLAQLGRLGGGARVGPVEHGRRGLSIAVDSHEAVPERRAADDGDISRPRAETSHDAIEAVDRELEEAVGRVGSAAISPRIQGVRTLFLRVEDGLTVSVE